MSYLVRSYRYGGWTFWCLCKISYRDTVPLPPSDLQAKSGAGAKKGIPLVDHIELIAVSTHPHILSKGRSLAIN